MVNFFQTDMACEYMMLPLQRPNMRVMHGFNICHREDPVFDLLDGDIRRNALGEKGVRFPLTF
jgi:hypothetical protein